MADKGLKSRIGGSGATRTIVQLVIASIIVGAIFRFIGLGPREFWEGVFDAFNGLVRALGESFGEIVGNLIAYLLIGAAVVVPMRMGCRKLAEMEI